MVMKVYFNCQGRRRVFKSGPAEEIIECRRHKRVESMGVRGSPPRKFWIFSASMCVLMGFYAFGTRFQSRFFARKDISWRVRKPNAKQNHFRIVTIFFTFFFSIFFRHYVTYVPAGFGKVLLALILGCHGWIQRGPGVRTHLKNHKNRVLSITGPDLLKNHKASKPAFNVGPLLARQPRI